MTKDSSPEFSTPLSALPPNLRSISFGRKGSFIQARRQLSGPVAATESGTAHPAPTNEAIAAALQERVAAAVELQGKYKQILWYTGFLAVYMLILYLQASAYPTGDITSTLRKAFTPDGGMTASFQSTDDVMTYIKERFIEPIWIDPVCGDGHCEYPIEYPSFGRFGCKADCGVEAATFPILVQVSNDFVGHPNLSPSTLLAAASWNLCSEDGATSTSGQPDRCWYEQDQVFPEIRGTQLVSMNVTAGSWYVWVKGDYAGRVFGAIYDLRSGLPVQVEETPAWQKCQYPSSSTASPAGQLRRLLLEANGLTPKKEQDDGGALQVPV
eukprot:jgi/Botrbrau1/12096/Bobra.0186s0019.1